MFDLEMEIQNWRNQLQLGNVLPIDSIEELEAHLRDEIDVLKDSGLSEDEALIVGIKRLGNTHTVTKAFFEEYGENVWRQLVIEPESAAKAKFHVRPLIWILFLALFGGCAFQIVRFLSGLHFDVFIKQTFIINLSLFAMPPVFLYFAISKCLPRWIWSVLTGLFITAALLINFYPFVEPKHTFLLSSLHLPIFLWLSCLLSYCGVHWKESNARMHFIRASGEIFIYTVLILCGFGVLSLFVAFIFDFLGMNASIFLSEYLGIWAILGSPAIAVYLVNAKRSVVENFAPILAKIFSPLFLILITVFLIASLVVGKPVGAEREFLIGFDLMLAVVIGLVVYSVSARDPHLLPGFNDTILWLLILVTIIADLFALSGIFVRLHEYGLSPNKIAALGENLILLGNLGILFFSFHQFIRKRCRFEIIELWQTRYLWVYFIWTGFVGLLFPIVFGFQ